MPAWRTSTWVWIACAIVAVVAEVIYAVNNDTDLQGHALGALIVVSIILGVYRGFTRTHSS